MNRKEFDAAIQAETKKVDAVIASGASHLEIAKAIAAFQKALEGLAEVYMSSMSADQASQWALLAGYEKRVEVKKYKRLKEGDRVEIYHLTPKKLHKSIFAPFANRRPPKRTVTIG